jgi:hypothetical protein
MNKLNLQKKQVTKEDSDKSKDAQKAIMGLA